MEIVAEIFCENGMVANVTYRSGFLVEITVVGSFKESSIWFDLTHSENRRLEGRWDEALDKYFNEGQFDSKDAVFPGEMRRIGSARDHKSLFLQASRALAKDLQPHGYRLTVRYG
jgi:hypothetical protein